LDEKAQVSFDYLILLTFVLGLVVVVSVLISAVQGIANRATGRINNYRDSTLTSILK